MEVDWLVKTNNVELAIEEIERKISDYVLLYQRGEALSPLSDFIFESFNPDELSKALEGWLVRADIENYTFKLLKGEDVGIDLMFKEYFEDNEFHVVRNEFFYSIIAILDYIARNKKIKYFVIVLTNKEVSIGLEKFINFSLGVERSFNFVVLDALNDTKIFQSSIAFDEGRVKLFNLFYPEREVMRGESNLSFEELFLDFYKWMLWEVCAYLLDQMRYSKMSFNVSDVEKVIYSYLGVNRNEDAIDYINFVLEELKEKGDALLLAKYNRLLAYVYAITQSRWNLTVDTARKALSFAFRSKDKGEIILSKSLLFFVGAILGEDIVELLGDIKKSRRKVKGLDFDKLYYHIVSFYYFFVSTRDIIEIEEIEKMLMKAFRYYKKKRDYFHLAVLHHLMGNLFIEKGLNVKAIREVKKSLKLAIKLKSIYISHIYNSLAHLLYTSEKFRESYKYSKEALLLTVKEGDIKEVCMTLVNMAYLYMTVNEFRKANFVMEMLFRIMSEAKIEELPIHSNVKFWVMDMYIKRQLGLVSPYVGMVYRTGVPEDKGSEAVGFYYWSIAMQTENLDEKIKILYEALEYIRKNEFKYVEVKILKDLIHSLRETGREKEAQDVKDYYITLRENYKFYRILLDTDKNVINLPFPKFNWELIINEARSRYNLLQLQDKISKIRFLERIQNLVISENDERLLIRRFLNIVLNSFSVDVVFFVDKESNDVYLPIYMDKSLDISSLVRLYIEHRNVPRDVEVGNSFVLPFVFSDGEVRGYLVIHNFSEGKFFRMEEKNILEISSMLVKSKLEILSDFRKIKKISKTDFLTGLPNRNEIENIAITEVERCNRDQNYDFSLALIDLDNFKYYNDTFGHMIGDLILKEFASLLRATVRKIDFVGRYGGDEFVVIMPSTDRNKAVLAAKRWIRKIFSSDFYMDILRSFSGSQVYIPEDKKLSMSVGVADFKEVGYNIQELFELADKRLYVSKSKGKSVVT